MDISSQELIQRLNDGEDIFLLDVRSEPEYKTGHLNGARLLPGSNLSSTSLKQVGLGDDSKDQEVVLYCQSGARSRRAGEAMKLLGFTNVKSLVGGLSQWPDERHFVRA